MARSQSEVTELLKSAAQAVNDAGLKGGMAEVGLGRAFDALSGTSRPMPAATLTQTNTADQAHGDDLIGKAAAKLNVTDEQLLKVADEDGGDVVLAISRSDLPDQKRPAMREIALLLPAIRQAAGIESQTAYSLVHDEIKNAGVFDKNHVVTDIRGQRNFINYKDDGKQLKVLRAGFEEAGKRIRKISGAEQ